MMRTLSFSRLLCCRERVVNHSGSPEDKARLKEYGAGRTDNLQSRLGKALS
jgi:hypothetical protein